MPIASGPSSRRQRLPTSRRFPMTCAAPFALPPGVSFDSASLSPTDSVTRQPRHRTQLFRYARKPNHAAIGTIELPSLLLCMDFPRCGSSSCPLYGFVMQLLLTFSDAKAKQKSCAHWGHVGRWNTHTHTYIYIYTCIHTYIQTYIHTYIHTCINIHT